MCLIMAFVYHIPVGLGVGGDVGVSVGVGVGVSDGGSCYVKYFSGCGECRFHL